MYAIIGAIITLFVLLITAIYNCLCGQCRYEISGGAGLKQKLKKEISQHSSNQRDMELIISSLSKNMHKELKPLFAGLFTDIYSGEDLPPVITIDDIKHRLPYEPNTRVFRPSTHIGQRKLFLTELQFLADEILADTHAVVIYAGAAPSNHTGYLSKLFPNVKFILVDPNPFDIFEASPRILWSKGDPPIDADKSREIVKEAADGRERIFIINDIFTMNLAVAISEIIPTHYFISDIRTNIHSGDFPDSLDILWNLAQQYNWMMVMKPASSMLKFRHPFYTDDPEIFRKKCREVPYSVDFELAKQNGIDFVKNFETKNLIYWDGKVNIQAWPGRSSTESRLITNAKSIRDWGVPTEYEDKYFYYNTIERCYGHHTNDNADPNIGFDHCNDCSLENHLWKNYIGKYSAVAKDFGSDVKSFVNKLSQITRRSLLRDNHGCMFGRYSYASLRQAVEMYNRDSNANIPPLVCTKNR